MADEYNPLDYDNLTKNCVDELMRRGPFPMPPQPAAGAGVYALFYHGALDFYGALQSPDAMIPIYVGKAVPPGARKGGRSAARTTALYRRLIEHARSIETAANLSLGDFLCRYLVVTPLWITMAERFLIEHYQPLWNVWIDGFGNHPPGKGRPAGEISWWDALHPGREWATRLRQTRTHDEARAQVKQYFETKSLRPEALSHLAASVADQKEAEDETVGD